MIRPILIGCLALLLHGAVAPSAHAQNPTKAQVQQAIERAVAYLKGRQSPDGSWRFSRQYQQGSTALCIYALLLGGVDPTDEVVRRGIRYMLSQPLAYTYCVSLVALALTEANPSRYKREIARCAGWLEVAHTGAGKWTYRSAGGRGHSGDNSNTQFAILGLWAAERAGVKVDARVWEAIRGHFRGSQAADGSWGYSPGRRGTMAMTLAGIGSLLIANGRMRKPGRT